MGVISLLVCNNMQSYGETPPQYNEPGYHAHQPQPTQQQTQINSAVYSDRQKSSGNVVVILTQILLCVCGCCCVSMAILLLGNFFFWTGSVPTVDTESYDANSFDIPNATESYTLSINIPFEGYTYYNDYYYLGATQLRMCLTNPDLTGTAQAFVPYEDFETDTFLDIPYCGGNSSPQNMPGLTICANYTVYVEIDNSNGSYFPLNSQLEVYYDDCSSSDECRCPFFLLYTFLYLIVIFLSVGFTIACVGCYCCCAVLCCGSLGIVTVIDMSNRSKRKAEMVALL